jgi:hypothetical protein
VEFPARLHLFIFSLPQIRKKAPKSLKIFVIFNLKTIIMEDLQSLMACLDDISSKIPDGIYLEMADKMKRIHDELNGNTPFHEDSFYYSDDDSELDSNSDDDSGYDSDYNERARRQVGIQIIRDHLIDYVRSMHQVWEKIEKWEKEVKKELPFIKRMTADRKSQAIKQWCVKNVRWAPGGEAGELVGHLSTAAVLTSGWTWKNLMENGLRAIVMDIGTEDEIVRAKRGFMCYDELSLATIQKLPAFEKKIYDDYWREHNEGLIQKRDEARMNVCKYQDLMQQWEMAAREEENKLRQLDAPVFNRDKWDAETGDFWVNDAGRMVDGP